MAKFNIIFLILFQTMLSSCLGQPGVDSKREFENNMAKALSLKFVVSDTDFEYSRLHIFKDTLVGVYKRSPLNKPSFSSAPNEYFIQNLIDTSKLTEFINYDLSYYTTDPFDCYRNECIYFPFGSGMRTLCSDGKFTEYFIHKQYNFNYTSKVILYKNEAILVRQTDISSFDIKSQKLIWKYNFPAQGITYSLLKGDSLFFSTWINRIATVVCYNLNNLSVIWKKRIEEREPNFAPADYEPSACLFQDNNNIVIPTWDSIYSLDMNTGKTVGKVPWKSFWGNQGINVLFKVENNQLFIDDVSDGLKITKCIDLITNKLIWKIDDSYFLGLYKSYVIANNTDWSYYLIIDKLTGLIKYKIPNSITKKQEFNFIISKRQEFNFIGDYILINRNAIYK